MSALPAPQPPAEEDSYQPGRAMLAVGRIAIAVVAVVTLSTACPTAAVPGRGGGATVLATALWLLILRFTELNARALGVSPAGCGPGRPHYLNASRPDGPGYLLVFMSVSTMGLRLPRRTAVAFAAPVLLAAGWAQAATSQHPVSAALNIACRGGVPRCHFGVCGHEPRRSCPGSVAASSGSGHPGGT